MKVRSIWFLRIRRSQIVFSFALGQTVCGELIISASKRIFRVACNDTLPELASANADYS